MKKEYGQYDYKVTAAGRVNVIGEHVDYCGGKVFPVALSQANIVYVKPNGTNKINIEWTTLPDKVTLDVDKLDSYKTLRYGNYQAGSALFWQRAGHKLVGCDMLQDCKVPFGSGLSSSAAIEVSTIAALATAAGESFSPVEIALTAQRAEREYAGVNCGIMDQYASACGKKDFAMLLNCKTLECEYVPFDLKEYAMMVVNTNKPHNLVDSKYNERRAETEEALKGLRSKLDVACLADVSEADFQKYGGVLQGKIYDRARHVVEECARVNKAANAMKRGDMPALGALLNESHASLKNLYEVTGKELDALASAAQSHPACIGARMTGAGFGGCIIALVRKDAAEDFKSFVAEKYLRAIGYPPAFYESSVADGITVKAL